MESVDLRGYAHLSPFEIKEELIRLARASGRGSAGGPGGGPARAFLNAGRGNPNWVATRAREVFFLLGQFGIAECRRGMAHPAGLAGMPREAGIAGRLADWLADRLAREPDDEAARAAGELVGHAVARFGFPADGFVHELADAIIGDNYPVPGRMLRHAEQVVRAYLGAVLGAVPGTVPGGGPDAGTEMGPLDLFAVEGGTAAIAYVLRSLKANRLLRPGDRIALATPIFSPYLEIPGLEDYALDPVYLEASEADGFQLSDAALDRLHDPSIRALFLVNPGNPTSVALSPAVRRRLAELVRTGRPDLMLLTDDVYATFVGGFRSLLAELPHNTIGVYSWSKYFGCTGWRLGAVALHRDNVFDRAIAALPEHERAELDRRYASLAPAPRALRFIDRMVADSRDVALNHTAGLSPPQQAMMTLFSLVDLMDAGATYRQACADLLARRSAALHEGLGLARPADPLSTNYYGLIDLSSWLRRQVGETVARWVEAHVHPLDMVFRLARDHGIVLLNGGGFHAPDWSVRISFANLDDDVYDDIGAAVRAIVQGYVDACHAALLADGAAPAG